VHLVMQFEISGLRGKHPYRNLQSLTCGVDDRGRTVSPLRVPRHTKAVTVQRMKRIENANVRGVCTQGIVGGWSGIPTFTASCPAAACRPITPAGSLHDPISS